MYQHSPSYTQPTGSTVYPGLPGYSHPAPANPAHTTSYNAQTPHPYPPSLPPPQQNHLNANAMMGAPWGAPPLPKPGRGGWGPHAHGNNHSSKPRQHNNNKRDHTTAFNKPQNTVPRTPAAPAVPSFGNPLPSKPPPVADATRKNKKRKRKHNQLGLTPKTDDHESSEEEEEVDEEAKLAQTGADAAAPLQFTYRGQTATLQSQSDIAAWIAERKKKFPTQARIDEKKKAAEEAKAVRDAARLEKQKERERDKAKAKPQDNSTAPTSGLATTRSSDPALDAAMKAQRKAEKIKRHLDREQKRFAKAEAEAEAARLKVEALQRQAQGLKSQDLVPEHNVAPAGVKPGITLAADGTTTTTTTTAADINIPQAADSTLPSSETTVFEPASVSAIGAVSDAALEQINQNADPDPVLSELSDWTSSSGSDAGSALDFDSDSNSGDSAPEEVSSRRQGPERVPAPPREGKKTVCRHFARTGRCKMGDRCRFSHEAGERGSKTKPVEKEKKGRKGLLQALGFGNMRLEDKTDDLSTQLLGRQKEDEDRRAMEVITWLGQNGHLAPPEPPKDDVQPGLHDDAAKNFAIDDPLVTKGTGDLPVNDQPNDLHTGFIPSDPSALLDIGIFVLGDTIQDTVPRLGAESLVRNRTTDLSNEAVFTNLDPS
ncbi:hypothetical protein N7539_003075 [Penicillium diatomitis]|uniref:C3H1-type domain-containing protein n=1 Tax=Penicillium diatomitis TaxID=2819901 RepID=A0A9W9XGL4_9EURO|nr:uncharacterized protein N7539_003075 [Penicillium diatomitis]KAJ5491508.1 hypothetical protein N7539_003075 [Penicillium diatomitis]